MKPGTWVKIPEGVDANGVKLPSEGYLLWTDGTKSVFADLKGGRFFTAEATRGK